MVKRELSGLLWLVFLHPAVHIGEPLLHPTVQIGNLRLDVLVRRIDMRIHSRFRFVDGERRAAWHRRAD